MEFDSLPAMLRSKRILVTQADAFMGPVLCEVLAAHGAELIASAEPLLDPATPAKVVAAAGRLDALVVNLAIPAPSTPATEATERRARAGEALELPLRDRNELLIAAGFAPSYSARQLDSSSLKPVRRALDLILSRHEPFPAFVLDAEWNTVLANDAHRTLLSQLLPEVVVDGLNVIELVFDPRLLRPHIVDWETLAHVLGRRVEQQLRLPGLGCRRYRHATRVGRDPCRSIGRTQSVARRPVDDQP